MNFTAIDRSGTGHTLSFKDGDVLMHVLRAADLGILAECDGCCVCATCHVYLADDWFAKVGPPGEDETFTLEEACAPTDRSRLSCQIDLSTAHAGMVLRIAPDED